VYGCGGGGGWGVGVSGSVGCGWGGVGWGGGGGGGSAGAMLRRIFEVSEPKWETGDDRAKLRGRKVASV